MFNGNIISIDTPDNHSIFMDSFRNEPETMLNTLLLAELTEFLSYDKYGEFSKWILWTFLAYYFR